MNNEIFSINKVRVEGIRIQCVPIMAFCKLVQDGIGVSNIYCELVIEKLKYKRFRASVIAEMFTNSAYLRAPREKPPRRESLSQRTKTIQSDCYG